MPLDKFVDALPIPSVITPVGNRNGKPYYEVEMKQVQQKLHRDLKPTTVWGYNGMYPGPTFEVRRNQPIYVKWENKLPFEHLLPVDRTVHGAELDRPSVRTVVHLHGGRNRPENDGYPEAWFTRNFKNVGPKFLHEVYYYPNGQRPATLWYHDHAVGITRLNVYAGLAGFYLIRDDEEEELNLPQGKYEIPILIQDRSFYLSGERFGELFYPSQPNQAAPPDPSPPIDSSLPRPSVVPEFFGNTALVNGKVWPYLEVEPRKYRFRILNASNARFYRLRLSSGQEFIQIGTDGGFLEKPVIVPHREGLMLGPAERADVIVDFSKHAGQKIILTNDAPSPFPSGNPRIPTLPQIMEFRVSKNLTEPDKSVIPAILSCLERLNPNGVPVRQNILTEIDDPEFPGRLKPLLNDMAWSELPITETPYNGTIEVWELYNLTGDNHPMHLHLVHFQVLNHAPITVDKNKHITHVGPPREPSPNEKGWKDTVGVNPKEVTRIIARFGPFTGIYPWHCHNLEHEDHEMMRPYEVLQNPEFDPRIPIPGQCSDDSFTQSFEKEGQDESSI